MSADAALLASITSLAGGASDIEIARALLQAGIENTPARRGAVRVRTNDSAPQTASVGLTASELDRITNHIAVFSPTRRPVVARPGSTLLRTLPSQLGVESLLSVVHEVGSTTIEVVLLDGEGDGLGFDDVDLVTALASMAGVVASNVASRGRNRRFEQWMHAIEDTAVVLLRGVAPRAVLDGVLDEVARHALHASGATLAGIATPDDNGTSMVMRIAVGQRREFLAGLPFPEDQSLCGSVMRSHRPVAVTDARHDARAYPPVVSELGLGPTSVGPLTLHDRVVGVVFVGNLLGDGMLDQRRALEAVAVDDLAGLVAATMGTLSISNELTTRLRRMQTNAEGWARIAALETRELEMLELVTDGLTNAEIGNRIGLAEKTVRNAVSVMLGKLGVANRVEAAVMMARHAERFGRLVV
jgi:DNA-binding CsgD family transcriptional regulator